MSIIKCKMCGGSLSYEVGSSVCECEYCGTKQTIPDTDDEKRLKLYERANKLRINNEFDKAAGVYESIVAEFQSEAEAYWGLVLCKYGIEYVDDPKTGKKIPTCHRSSFDAVFDDANFDLVMENADTVARSVYREEAKQIEELRKGIIEVSSKEEPYDIFICYKETADDGQRTIDSVIAQDVYDELTAKGYRVFFSRITLEDKLGQEYEPYIFAALNSAKVMLVFGTQYDYLNAVWVKNEWSRFLQLMESGQKKTLIPCYKNIDAYDMPKEFAKLQAQDMGKVGAIQDLTRGIDKIFDKDTKTTIIKQPTEILTGNFAYCERGFIFLEDHKWEEAKGYFDKALDLNPKDAKSYLGLFLVEINASSLEEYINRRIENLDKIKGVSLPACEPDYERIRRIAKECSVDGYLSEEHIISSIVYQLNYTSISQELEKKAELSINNSTWKKVERFAEGDVLNEINMQRDRYRKAVDEMVLTAKKNEESEIERIKKGYEEYLDYKENKIKTINEKALKKKDEDYVKLCDRSTVSEDIGELILIRTELQKLNGYRDSVERIEECSNRISQLEETRRIIHEFDVREKEEKRNADRMKRIKTIRIASAFVITILVVCLVITVVIRPLMVKEIEYRKAVAYYNAGEYSSAMSIFKSLDKFRDSEKMYDYSSQALYEADYQNAQQLMDTKDYLDAGNAFSLLGDYKDSENKVEQCYDQACGIFTDSLSENLNKEKFSDIENEFNQLKSISKDDIRENCINKFIDKYIDIQKNLVIDEHYQEAVRNYDNTGFLNESIVSKDGNTVMSVCSLLKEIENLNDGEAHDLYVLYSRWLQYSEEFDLALIPEFEYMLTLDGDWICDKTWNETTNDEQIKNVGALKYGYSISNGMMQETQNGQEKANEKWTVYYVNGKYYRYYYSEFYYEEITEFTGKGDDTFVLKRNGGIWFYYRRNDNGEG